MRALMRLIQRGPDLTMHARQLSKEIGDGTFDVLMKNGVLERDDPADWYPCPGPEGDGCPMRVIENPGHPTHSHIAVCGCSPSQCQDVHLNEEDLEQVTISFAGYVRTLRALFKVDGDFDLKNEAFPGVRSLGESAWGGVRREAFLATDPSGQSFPSFLALRRKEPRAGSLVLAPSRRWMKYRALDQQGPSDPVKIVILEDTLAISNGEIVINAPAAQANSIKELSSQYRSPPAPFCTLIDQDGERTLTEPECRALQARAADFDLFIDLMTPVDAGRYRAGRRDAEGFFEEKPLTANQAAVLVELISKRKPLRADELKSVDLVQPAKRLEEARKLIDINLSRYNWRSIKTLRGDTPEAKRFFFDPPEGLRFAVLGPLGDEARVSNGQFPEF